jgi:5-oxoprolinase (ATP-hydrolysing) subunit A
MTKQIDLNCDMGEGMDNDALLMPLISSANIACGFHAGDDSIIRATVALAKKSGVSIGAHPGFADKENFGRTEMQLSETELYQLIWNQLALMQSICGHAPYKTPWCFIQYGCARCFYGQSDCTSRERL